MHSSWNAGMLESLDAEGIIASASASSSIVSNPVYVQSDSTTEIEDGLARRSPHMWLKIREKIKERKREEKMCM